MLLSRGRLSPTINFTKYLRGERRPRFPRRVGNVDVRQPEEASAIRVGDSKILLGNFVIGTADSVHKTVRDTESTLYSCLGTAEGRQLQRNCNGLCVRGGSSKRMVPDGH